MNKDTERAKDFVKSGFILPFEGRVRCTENEISVWTTIDNEDAYISVRVSESDSRQDVENALIEEWEIKKKEIESQNKAWEHPMHTQGFRGDSLTL